MQNIIELETSRKNINWKNFTIVTTFHLLVIPALFFFSWQNVAAMIIGNWIVGSLGVGLGYHRLLTHRSFKAPKWLEYFLTALGTMSVQDDAPKWVATHRIHHAFTETDKDPHSTQTGILVGADRLGFVRHGAGSRRGDFEKICSRSDEG